MILTSADRSGRSSSPTNRAYRSPRR
jgi:hypothetical protein